MIEKGPGRRAAGGAVAAAAIAAALVLAAAERRDGSRDDGRAADVAATAGVTASAGAPGKPRRARFADAGPWAITIAWRRVRGASRYLIRYRRAGARRWRTRRIAGHRTSLTQRRLRPGRLYVFRVRACARRCGPASRRLRTTTLLAPPLDPYPSLGSCAPFAGGGSGGPSRADLLAWTQDVSSSPVHPQSAQIMAAIAGLGGNQSLHPDFGSPRAYGIPYIVVPRVQPGVPILFGNGGEDYGDESDRGPRPVPIRAPIEGGSDNHVIVVDRARCHVHELYNAAYAGGLRNAWRASSVAAWSMRSGALRPAGWTSADAAGLPIFPGLARFDEVAAGRIPHAIRITFSRTRAAYVRPATHFASSHCDQLLPPMGLRLRLKALHDISGLGGQARAVAEALKRHGAIVADNGSNFFITGTTDSRWRDGELNQLKGIPGSAFEVVQSAAAPVVSGAC